MKAKETKIDLARADKELDEYFSMSENRKKAWELLAKLSASTSNQAIREVPSEEEIEEELRKRFFHRKQGQRDSVIRSIEDQEYGFKQAIEWLSENTPTL